MRSVAVSSAQYLFYVRGRVNSFQLFERGGLRVNPDKFIGKIVFQHTIYALEAVWAFRMNQPRLVFEVPVVPNNPYVKRQLSPH